MLHLQNDLDLRDRCPKQSRLLFSQEPQFFTQTIKFIINYYTKTLANTFSVDTAVGFHLLVFTKCLIKVEVCFLFYKFSHLI